MKKTLLILTLSTLFTAAIACRTISGRDFEPAATQFEPPVVPSPSTENQAVVIQPADTQAVEIQLTDTQLISPTTHTPNAQEPTSEPTQTEQPPLPENIVPVSEAQEIPLEGSPPVPDDILEQIGMFQGYGAGFSACIPFAVDQEGVVQWDEYTHQDGASVAVTDLDLTWCACGFTEDLVEALLISPDGEIQPMEVLEGEISEPGNRCPMLWLTIEPGMPLGEYTVQLLQHGEVLEDRFTLEIPDEPTGVWTDEGAWFVGFQPGEKVRILVYGKGINNPGMDENLMVGRFEFLGESLTEADQNGTLLLNINETTTQQYTIYIAVISHSGQTATASMNPILDKTLLKYVSRECGAALPMQLKVGDSALVVRDELLLNAEPYHETITSLGNLSNGSLVTIIDGPVCEVYDPDGEAYWLWEVETQDGMTGWAVEVDHRDYALLPGE